MKYLEENVYQRVSDFFKALGDPTRIKIIWVLNQNELCVSDLATSLEMTQSAISHQLAYLRKANLINFHKKGKEVYYFLADDHVKSMLLSGIEHVHE